MATPSNGNIFRVTDPLSGESTGDDGFPSQRPVTQSVFFFDLCLNTGWASNRDADELRRSLWRHCGVKCILVGERHNMLNVSISSGNGLVPNGWQCITRCNNEISQSCDEVPWYICTPSDSKRNAPVVCLYIAMKNGIRKGIWQNLFGCIHVFTEHIICITIHVGILVNSFLK